MKRNEARRQVESHEESRFDDARHSPCYALVALLALLFLPVPGTSQSLGIEGQLVGERSLGRLIAERLGRSSEWADAAEDSNGPWFRAWAGQGLVPVDSTGRFAHPLGDVGRWRLRLETQDGFHVLYDLDWVEHHIEEIEFQVPATQITTIRAVDAGGAPIPGARLLLDLRDSRVPRRLGRVVSSAATDASGTARLVVPRPQVEDATARLRVEIVAAGFVPRALTPEEVDALERGRSEVVLEAGRPLEIVARMSGQPVMGADLRPEGMHLAVARTNEEGVARIWVPVERSAEDSVGWVMQAPGWAAPVALGRPPRLAERPPSGAAEVASWPNELVREPCVGRVERKGRPVPGAYVWIRGSDALTQTDDEGRFCLPTFRVRSGTDLPVSVEDEERLVVDGGGLARTETTWGRRDRIEVAEEFQLHISGVDETGEPVVGARVRLSERPQQLVGIRIGWASRWIEASTNSAGHAVVGISREPHVIEVSKPGRRTWFGPLAPFPPSWNRSELEIVMPPGTRHEGWVIDGADQPIAGAEVFVLPMERVRNADRIRLWPQASSTVVTDEHGRFEIVDHPPGAVALAVEARGFVQAVVRGIELDAGGGALGTVMLEAGFDLEGRVVSEDGQPLASVQVGLLPGAEEVRWRQRTDTRTTGVDGRFLFEDLASEERRLWFRHPEFVADQAVVQVPTVGVFDFVLTAGLRVPVSVVLDDGSRPMVAKIEAMQQDRSPPARTSDQMAGGVGVLEGLRAGTYWMTVTADQSDPLEFQARFDDRGELPSVEILEPGLPAGWDGERLRITMPAGVTLSGSVRDRAGDLLENVQVAADRKRVFAADGHFELRNLPPRQTDLRVGAAGFVPHQQTLELERDLEVDVELERGGVLSGLVLDPSGVPAPNVHVQVGPVRGGSAQPRGGSTTDAEGRYRIEGRPEGVVELVVRDPRYMVYGPMPVEVLGGETVHDIQLAAGVRLFGRVLGLPEHMIGRASLLVRQEPRGISQDTPVLQDGSYEFVGLSPGPLHLRLGSGFDRPAARRVDVPDLPEFEYDFEIGDASLAGVVLEQGQPQPDLYVMLVPGSEVGETAPGGRTDPEGRFLVELLDEGRYELVVSSAGSLLHREEVWISGQQEIVVELQARRLEGVVRGVDGEPIHGARLVLASAGDAATMWDLADVRAVTDAAGGFVLRVLPSESDLYDLRVIAQGYASQVVSADLGGPAPLEVVLDRQRWTLVIEWADERPAPDTSVFLLDQAGRVLVQRDNAGHGDWVVRDVPETAASVVLLSSFTTVAAELPRGSGDDRAEDRARRLRMTWPATGAVLLQPEPALPPVTQITVRLRDGSGRLVPAPVGGRLRTLRTWWQRGAPVATLPEGIWTLERVENGVVTQTATFEVVAGTQVVAAFR